jgi:Na+/proline symporter
MIHALALLALSGSGALYLILAWRIHQRSTKLSDQFPLTQRGGQAHVLSAKEFSAATVSATISLATVVLAFADLAGSMGLWLLWPVITTTAGILVVRSVAPLILERMSRFGAHRPTLHEFLGAAYQSVALMRTAAACTSLGFLGAFAVELSVGSRFLANLVPAIPAWIAVIVLAGVGVTYTALGGFRAVVVTDRIQMWAIWAAILALGGLIVWQIADAGGWLSFSKQIPSSVYDFSWRPGLGAFLIGIFVINVPTFVADMAIWQRIAGSTNQNVAMEGLWSSMLWTAVSWVCLAAIACSLVALISTSSNNNLLFEFLVKAGQSQGFGSSVLFLAAVAGLYAANLSTASTQLIATAQAVHTDLLRQGHDKETLLHASSELALSRKILVVAAIVAIVVVEGLTRAGFSIADLVFAVYGAQLGMVPAVLIALLADGLTVRRLRRWAPAAVFSGFVVGWGSAGIGKVIASDDLVFLAPAISLIISSVIFGIGRIWPSDD